MTEGLDFLRERAYAMLKPTRVAHVMGCEEEAASLALRWGADEGEARRAAIVHDCTKRLSLKEQLELCEKYGLEPDETERESAALLHSKTGAAAAKELFGLSDEVCGAVRWHTTGRAGMTLLEKIIYLADMIEPTREFPGVEGLRSMAYEDLDGALTAALAMSLENMRNRGIIPHRNSAEALRYLMKLKGEKDGD